MFAETDWTAPPRTPSPSSHFARQNTSAGFFILCGPLWLRLQRRGVLTIASHWTSDGPSLAPLKGPEANRTTNSDTSERVAVTQLLLEKQHTVCCQYCLCTACMKCTIRPLWSDCLLTLTLVFAVEGRFFPRALWLVVTLKRWSLQTCLPGRTLSFKWWRKTVRLLWHCKTK